MPKMLIFVCMHSETASIYLDTVGTDFLVKSAE